MVDQFSYHARMWPANEENSRKIRLWFVLIDVRGYLSTGVSFV